MTGRNGVASMCVVRDAKLFAMVRQTIHHSRGNLMHMIYRSAAGAGLVLFAAGAFAHDAVAGWYVGLGAGAADYADNIPRQIASAYAGNPTFDFLGASTTDSTDSARQVFVGYRFTPWLGAEVGYQDLGHAHTFYSLD